MSVKLDPGAPDGFVVNSFTNDDPIECRDHVRAKAGIAPFKPNGQGRHRAPADSVERALMAAMASQSLDSKPPAGRVTATYDYRDADGKLLYQVARLEPKEFRQRRPDGKGGWIWKLDERRVPYSWPELLKFPDATIFITEGEKDADRVASVGHCATTVASGKWTDDCVKALAGRDLIILEDNDEAGRKKALEAAIALHGAAKSIRVVSLPGLPDKGDVSDWLDADTRRAESFVDVCLNVPEWIPPSTPATDGNEQHNTESAKASDTQRLVVWDAGDDTELPPPRGFLLGNVFARGFLASLLAEGGTGKTALRYAQYLSLTTGRALTGEHVFQRCRVLVVSLEDDDKELRRRILAARLHHKIELSELRGWLFLSAPGAAGGKLMAADKSGRLVRGTLADRLEAIVVERGIDLVSLDPFVKSHSVDENSNSAIDDVVQVLTDLAAKHNIAVDTPHHISKGTADPGNASRGRGASAMKDGGRLIYTASPMNTEEAKTFGIAEDQRRQIFRVDSAKVNIAPPMHAAKWFRLVGVPLGNATDLYPNGDNVQTVEPWTPPDVWAGLGSDILNTILTTIDGGLQDGSRYTDAPNANDRAAWKAIREHAPDKAEGQAREIIKAWVKNGVLVTQDYDNPVTRKTAKGLVVDPQKRPS